MDSFPLHCNKCYRRRVFAPNLEFFISRCGHILCDSCLDEKCPKCLRVFNGVLINNNIPPGMSDYFDNPLKLLRHFQKVTKFQYEQERSLVDHMMTSNAEAEKRAKDEQRTYMKIKESLQRKLDKEIERKQKYRDYIAYHDRRLEQSRYMKPPITAQPRPRYPARKNLSDPVERNMAVDVNFMNQLTQTLKGNFSAPNTPSVSTNDDSSIKTGPDSISEIFRQMSTLPPEQKKSKNFFYTRHNAEL